MRESNNKENGQETRLEDQDQIVNQYLEALLSEVAEYSETETKTEQETKKETAEIIEIRPAPEVVSEEVEQQVVERQVGYVEEELEDQDVREAPDWAQEPFQCLVIRIGDLTFATPLLALDNIVKWESDLTTMPFQPEWHLGVLQNREHKTVVVDTARLLIPELTEEDAANRQNGSHILIIGDHHFGLACDSLAKPVILTKDDVHWSIKHPNRPWMAGTIREKLTIVLDVNALLEMIRHE